MDVITYVWHFLAACNKLRPLLSVAVVPVYWLDLGLIGFGPPQTVFQKLIFISRVVIVPQCQLILAIFHGFTWRWEQSNVLGNTVMHQLMTIQPQWRLTVCMGETAGLIFLGRCGEQIYGQQFRPSNSTFKSLCNKIESFFVLITKKSASTFGQMWTSLLSH